MNDTARWKIIGYAAVLFLLGGVCGAVVAPKLLPPAQQTLKLGRESEIATMMRAKLKAKLDLTPDQEQKIEPFIKATSESLEASHGACLKSVLAAINKMHGDIAPILQPAQIAKLKELDAERVESWRTKYNYTGEAPAGH